MPDVTETYAAAELRNQWSRFEYVIALDPGKTTGCAIYDADADEVECRTLDFWQAAALAGEFAPSVTAVLVEDPRFNAPTFEHGEHGRRKREKISQNVGQNKEQAGLLVDRFDGAGFTTKAVRPRGAKWDAGKCRMLTGYDRTPNNQHIRDAIRLLFNEGVI